MLGRFLRPRRADTRALRTLWLFTRPGCGLCERLRADLGACRLPFRWELREWDVRSDAALEERYGNSIPVLWLGDRIVCKGRWERSDLERRLKRMHDEDGGVDALPPGVT